MDHNAKSKLEFSVSYPVSKTLDYYVSMANILKPKKKAKKHDLSTITLGYPYSK